MMTYDDAIKFLNGRDSAVDGRYIHPVWYKLQIGKSGNNIVRVIRPKNDGLVDTWYFYDDGRIYAYTDSEEDFC